MSSKLPETAAALSRRQNHFRGRGFSLVEIMVVLVIIGLLAGMVTINVRGYVVRAKQNTARAELATISEALNMFYTLRHHYPTNEEGLAVLTKATEQDDEPLLERLPADPWGNAYQYNRHGRAGPYEVFSLGADGREGGEGADKDIGSWELAQR